MRNKDWKTKLLLSEPLTETDWSKLFARIFNGQMKFEEAKILLLLPAKTGEDVQEIRGCLKTLRRLEPARRLSLPYLMDLCGTGGDGMRTFNISTVSSFVIAGAGGYVAKHGNRGVSSSVGSSDLMEALGVRLEAPLGQILKALRECRLGYFHAPLYHPSFAKVRAVRSRLGVRTIFNLMGPMTNPVGLGYQMIGVSNEGWMEPAASALSLLRRKRAVVFRSLSGLDELSTFEASDIFYIAGNRIKKRRFDPRPFGFSKARIKDYAGGDLKQNRNIALDILKGRLRGPREEVVLLNSGFALWLTGLSRSIQEGIERSRWAIRSGRALGVLEALCRVTQQSIKQ